MSGLAIPKIEGIESDEKYGKFIAKPLEKGFGTTLGNASPMMSGPFAGLAAVHAAAVFAPMVLAAVLGLMFLIAYGISKLGSAPRRAADPWLCGYVREADCHRYVAHNFYGEIKRYFRWLGGAPQQLQHDSSTKADRSVRPTVLKELP